MINLSDHFTLTRNRVILFFAVPLLVVGWHLVFGGETLQQRRILSEFGTVKKVIDVPRPNHAGTKLVYGQDSPEGLQVCLYDLATGGSKILFEQSEKEFKSWNFRVLGWSPDDKYFAYYCLPGENKAKQVVICDGDSGATVGEVRIGSIASGTWLSSQAIVGVGIQGDGTLYETKRQGDVPWAAYHWALHQYKTAIVPQFNREATVSGITAYKDGTAVWAQGGAIWICDPLAAAPRIFLQLTNSPIFNLSYSPQTGKFLLFRVDRNDDVLSSYDPGTGELSDLERANHHLLNGFTYQTWVNGGEGYACVVADLAMCETLIIKKTLSSEPVRLLWPNRVLALSASDQQIFVVGSLTNEPTAIWRYDLTDGSLDSAIPNLAHPFQYTVTVPSSHTVITNTDDRWRWDLYAPVDLSPHKKHPALISAFGPSESYPQTVANCGVYYVGCGKVFRLCPPGLFDVFYRMLADNPNIDTNRLFLMSSSADNQALYRLIEDHPGRFRGAVLLSPVGYPDPASILNMKILVDGARDDAAFDTNGVARLAKFQDAALLAGVPVIAAIHAVGGHGDTFRMVSTDEERLRQIIKFVSEP